MARELPPRYGSKGALALTAAGAVMRSQSQMNQRSAAPTAVAGCEVSGLPCAGWPGRHGAGGAAPLPRGGASSKAPVGLHRRDLALRHSRANEWCVVGAGER